ncbi:MAG TPA: YdeI/OmpD-associated family protein [Thermoleophilaceae bacterium]|nr:YdeI/OmpD-associated family protein [Thermoleophilaceae bacterium]
MKDEPVLFFEDAEGWDAWLAENHASSSGVRLKIAKKGRGIASVAYPEVLDTAISYGWIDGVRNALDDTYFLQRFVPRSRRSKWSKINCAKAEALIASGRMKPAGLREVERAKEDGRWDAAYEGQRVATVPPDLQAALDANPAAREFFGTLNSQNRYAVLYRVKEAKRPETRARRIAKFVDMLARGEKLHP